MKDLVVQRIEFLVQEIAQICRDENLTFEVYLNDGSEDATIFTNNPKVIMKMGAKPNEHPGSMIDFVKVKH